ncbi:MAG TPA: DUF6152 family protein [Gammaproteobacteria bacterium]
MKRTLSTLVTAASLLAANQFVAGAANAHHSATPFYDATQTVEITGVVTRWSFVNPHPFLYVDVETDQGETQEWIIEFAGPVRLQKIGWSTETFTPGETIRAVGNPPKAEGVYGMFAPDIYRADGTLIEQVGEGPPGIGRPQR